MNSVGFALFELAVDEQLRPLIRLNLLEAVLTNDLFNLLRIGVLVLLVDNSLLISQLFADLMLGQRGQFSADLLELEHLLAIFILLFLAVRMLIFALHFVDGQ